MKRWISFADGDLLKSSYLEPKSQKRKSRSQDEVVISSEPRRSPKKEDQDNIDDDLLFVREIPATASKSVDWLEKFKPKSVEDLAVHPKKIQDLRGWFELYQQEKEQNPCRILTIEGPPGSSKTIGLSLIAKEFNFEIIEFDSPIDIDSELFQEERKKFVYTGNQVEKFLDFLLKSSRFGSIFSKKNRLLLVKDFPNTFLKKKEEFWDVLRQYKSLGNAPLVFIITETNSRTLNISYNLFPENVKLEFLIESISFNSISNTLMKKAMKRICSKIESDSNFKKNFNLSTNLTRFIDPIVEQAQGDIRNAILNFSFAAQKGSLDVKLTNFKPKGKSKKNEKKAGDNDDSGMGKNEAISIMHGLGRVFYPKYEPNSQSGLQMLTHRPETIANSFLGQQNTFLGLIHSNYIKNFSDIEDLNELTNIFSLSDLLQTEYRESSLHEVNLDMVIRATMILNKKPMAGFRAINGFGDKKFKNTQQEQMQAFKSAKNLNNGNLMPTADYFCDYRFFSGLIDPSTKKKCFL